MMLNGCCYKKYFSKHFNQNFHPISLFKEGKLGVVQVDLMNLLIISIKDGDTFGPACTNKVRFILTGTYKKESFRITFELQNVFGKTESKYRFLDMPLGTKILFIIKRLVRSTLWH